MLPNAVLCALQGEWSPGGVPGIPCQTQADCTISIEVHRLRHQFDVDVIAPLRSLAPTYAATKVPDCVVYVTLRDAPC